MTPPTTQECLAMHESYVRSTGLSLQFTMARIYAWERFSVHGFNTKDIALVARFLKGRIHAKVRHPECLLFRNLIENVDRFEEDLAQARSFYRQGRQSEDQAKASVLKATGRAIANNATTARSAAQIIANSEALRKFQEFKATL